MSATRPTHPGSGAGSCAACRGALGLDAVRSDGTWYCSPACVHGLPASERRRSAVDEARLYHRPRRFYRRRRPKELRREPRAS